MYTMNTYGIRILSKGEAIFNRATEVAYLKTLIHTTPDSIIVLLGGSNERRTNRRAKYGEESLAE